MTIKPTTAERIAIWTKDPNSAYWRGMRHAQSGMKSQSNKEKCSDRQAYIDGWATNTIPTGLMVEVCEITGRYIVG